MRLQIGHPIRCTIGLSARSTRASARSRRSPRSLSMSDSSQDRLEMRQKLFRNGRFPYAII